MKTHIAKPSAVRKVCASSTPRSIFPSTAVTFASEPTRLRKTRSSRHIGETPPLFSEIASAHDDETSARSRLSSVECAWRSPSVVHTMYFCGSSTSEAIDAPSLPSPSPSIATSDPVSSLSSLSTGGVPSRSPSPFVSRSLHS